jgi:hypothetical protein
MGILVISGSLPIKFEESGSWPPRIDHPFVHVHVEKVRAALHLLSRHSQCPLEIAC